MPRARPWEGTDELWERGRPLIPPTPSHARGGRPRLSDRRAFEAMVYVLRSGIQWNALPREVGASSTVHDRYQEWEQAGLVVSPGLIQVLSCRLQKSLTPCFSLLPGTYSVLFLIRKSGNGLKLW